ncbi:PD-(D/E)XK nuclease domain-containing protein [Wolbachia endosymbiont (group B) of Limnophora tigrina]|uniref:PD-(D/E)XK nuclease domain-containing protein n=1 Tax=Wolbachia endosymbiont (group B) of Limnophora tigrina TaxID=3139317 RepID=UPI0035B567C7
MLNKPELIELLLTNLKEFEKKFQELLSRVPNIHSPNKIEFFTHFFLGSVLTIAHTQLMKNIIINNIFWKIIRDETAKITTLKLIFKISDDGKNKLIFRTVTTAKDISLLQHYNNNELKELKKRALEGVFMNECDISGKIFHIRAAENLEEEDSNKDEKKGKSFKLKVEDLKVKESEGEEGEALHEALEKIRNLSTISEEFHEINVGSRNSSFDDLLSELSSLNIDKVEKAIEGIFKKLADIYKEHLDKTESAYHSFVYGFLAMNYKYRYDLDCYVERIEGKGYTDLILISRKRNKDWNAIPVVVEFKAGTESVDKAIEQIKNRGYLYTPLSMRTSAKEGVMVGVNFALNPPVVAEKVEIYQSQGFIDELLSRINGLLRATDNEQRDNIKNDLKEKIEKEIKYLYFAASGVKTENYLSRLILGQMLTAKVPNGSKHIFIHNSQHFSFYGTDEIIVESRQVSTFIIKKQSEKFIFNILEYKGKGVPRTRSVEPVHFENRHVSTAEIKFDNQYTQFNIKINSESVKTKSLEISVSCINDFSEKEYQGKSSEIKNITLDSFFDIKEGDSKDVTREDQESQNESINMLEKKLLPHKGLIESESHFQAVMQGLLMNYKKEDKKTLVFTEANPSGQGRVDLVVSLFGKNNNEHKITVIE